MASAWAPASIRSGSLAAAEQPKNLDTNMDTGVSDPLFRWLLRIRPPRNEVVIAAAAISVPARDRSSATTSSCSRTHVSLRRTPGIPGTISRRGRTDLHAAKLGKVADASPIRAEHGSVGRSRGARGPSRAVLSSVSGRDDGCALLDHACSGHRGLVTGSQQEEQPNRRHRRHGCCLQLSSGGVAPGALRGSPTTGPRPGYALGASCRALLTAAERPLAA
jgi:hypothetical protein